MRCMACGAKMVLITAIEDWNMPVLGFERETYMCLGCGDIEHRTAFNKQIKERHDAEVAALLAAPPLAPPATADSPPKTQGFIGRMLAKIRG